NYAASFRLTRACRKDTKSQRGNVGVRCQWSSIDDPVSCIPSPTGTDSIKQHLDSLSEPHIRRFRHAAYETAPQGHQTVGCWHHPTAGSCCPGPAVLVGVEPHFLVCGPISPFH